MAVTKFLRGSRPRAVTRQKLERWYVKEVAESGRALDVHAAEAALRVLMQGLPPAERPAAAAEAISFFDGLYQRLTGSSPPWLTELRESLKFHG